MPSLFSELFSSRDPVTARVPDGQRVYAVGDVHGRIDLLDRLLALVEQDIAARPAARNVLVFLGDLIDRGPASMAVIERIQTYCHPGVRVVALCGNHEESLLRLLNGDADLLEDWLRFGGDECARSYGLRPSGLRRLSPQRAVAALRGNIPKAHRAFLNGMVDTVRIGGYLFVHAGIRPGVPLQEQAQADLRWIREPFLSDERDHGFVVVHGHTIVEEVEERPNRIAIDTGGYRHGVLTALCLEGTKRKLLQARARGSLVSSGPAAPELAEPSF